MKKAVCFLLVLFLSFGIGLGFSACSEEIKIGSRYEITAEYIPENNTLAGTAKIAFENQGEGEISILKFQLHPNAYRKDALYKPVPSDRTAVAYYAGESYGEMVISSVNGAKNWEIMGEDRNILYAYLERSLFPGDEVVLDVGFLLKLAKVNHRTGITEKTVNLGNFFPILCGVQDGGFYENVYYCDGDPFFSDCAHFKVTIKTPKEYVVASSGALLDERTLESKTSYTYSLENARDFALVLSTRFRVVDRQVGKTKISYYYYDDTAPNKQLETAEEAISYFNKTFGEYPYATYSLVQTGLCFAGMEYPALAMISDELKDEEKPRVIVHETAHQWWYGVVGNNQVEYAWLDEGVAEYSALLFFEEYEKYGVLREQAVAEALKEYRSYYDVYGSVLGRTDTRMNRGLGEYLSEYEYTCIAYDKAVIMLDTLRKSVGDKKFLSSLKKYYKENKFRIATPAHFISAFEKNGLDVGGFFDSFLSGKGVL